MPESGDLNPSLIILRLDSGGDDRLIIKFKAEDSESWATPEGRFAKFQI
jgi:hypothetical protein